MEVPEKAPVQAPLRCHKGAVMQRLSGRLSDDVKAPVKALQAARFRRAAAAASDAVPGGRFRCTGARFRCAGARFRRVAGALFRRASGACFRCAFKRCLRRRAPLGSIAGVVRRHLHASLGRVKGATVALLGRFISAIGGVLERGRYRRH